MTGTQGPEVVALDRARVAATRPLMVGAAEARDIAGVFDLLGDPNRGRIQPCATAAPRHPRAPQARASNATGSR